MSIGSAAAASVFRRRTLLGQSAVLAAIIVCLIYAVGLINKEGGVDSSPVGWRRGLAAAAAAYGDRDFDSNQTSREFQVPHCGCRVKIPAPKKLTSSKEEIPFKETTCSRLAYERGRGQKVVGFSFYGDSRSKHHKSKEYYKGIVDNLRLMPKFYPGWTMRLYYDIDPGDPIREDICRLACEDPENLDICYVQDLPGTPAHNASFVFAMNWRFFPTLDPQVDAYVSRDLDSLFSDREEAAVKAWLRSDKSFHIMRDHPLHGINILGSGWGVKLDKQEVRDKWRASWIKGRKDVIMWAARNVTGPDQGFLRRYVWPWAKRDALQHDSYTCRLFPGTMGFPTKRRNETNNFIAAVVAQDMYIYDKCPLKCRPKEHKDWEYC